MNQTDVNYLPQTQQFQCRNNVTQLNEKEKMINETDKTFQSEHHDSQTHLIKDNNVYKSKDNVDKISKQLFISSSDCIDNNKEECATSHKKLFLITKNTPNTTCSTCSSSNDNSNNINNNNTNNDNKKKIRRKGNNNDLDNKGTNHFTFQLFNINNYESNKPEHKIEDETNNNCTSVCNNKNNCTNDDIQNNKPLDDNEKTDSNVQPPCEIQSTIVSPPIISTFKENYLDLLIISADSLIRGGLNISTLPQSDSPINSNLTKSHKCDNKLCPVIFNKHNTSYKITMNSLHKQTLHLCMNCYHAFQKEQYCYYCGIIYREYKGKKGFNDNKTWIACEYCSHWEHLQCEEMNGLFKNLSALIKDNKFKYMCPICREKEKRKGKGKGRLIKFVNNKRKRNVEGNGNKGRGVKKKKICRGELSSDVEKILLLEEKGNLC